jgi:hypothetical protein
MLLMTAVNRNASLMKLLLDQFDCIEFKSTSMSLLYLLLQATRNEEEMLPTCIDAIVKVLERAGALKTN